ncbi:hypothetical protein Mp_1g02380 [Marchantia polymorpha subsp. ruderalis]|uniref:Uncharacterized protein n=2 Tax=Marchantia polymorpha TaxID=3197 RepID=A0AAF6AKP9_MARPO|nr:hypothetical protein MARPO_0029s0009 [Marchantia polymorpha]BBM97019.1 hypothetical protein Mp_1g02380 [Marchantia polymorpha subsp. ruderalis]|eukprot:PTQ42462.1 hypothetical protein MARPO_0029s0009 [Marchantia polymorpha]
MVVARMMGSSHQTRECANLSQFTGRCYYQRLGVDLEELLDGSCSDFTITVQGKAFPLHRCILSARCSFFRKLFRHPQIEEPKTELDLGKVANLEKVGQEAFLAVVKYIYGGRVRLLGSAVTCLDDTCSHEACNPVVKYVEDFLRTAAVFDLPELKGHGEHHLCGLVDKVPGEYLTSMMKVAKTHGAEMLYNRCIHVLANKCNWNYRSLQKSLGDELANQVKELRKTLGLLMPTDEDERRDTEAWRVQRALDSDDVELVQMLLKEGQFSFDDVHGLHYAAGHCDEKIVRELLDLELSNPNVKDYSGYTVLHIACMRRQPEILAGLLAKGARPNDVTPDGRTGSQIVKRLTKKGGDGFDSAAEEEAQRARLCLEILEQAAVTTNTTYSRSFREVVNMPVTSEEELVQKLLYLENRVGLAKVLFPREAQIVMNLAHLEATSEFTGVDKAGAADNVSASNSPLFSAKAQALKRFPATSQGPKVEGSEGGLDATLLRRVTALQKTVELGHRFFPRCSEILNKYMDDDMGDNAFVDKVNPDEHSTKKQRLDELKEILAEAFTMDVADMDEQKGSEKLPPSLSSSSSSSQGGSPSTRSPHTKIG